MDALRYQYLEAMGITVWERRDRVAVSAVPDAAPVPAPVSSTETAVPDAGDAGWSALEGMVAACTACELHRTRTQTVFGVGNRTASWLVIGEAPGADEDRQGEPFVGRAGRLLNEMLYAAGFARGDVYIANVLKCRPPNNRDPKPEEAACCEHFLLRQVALIGPSLILAVGRIAAQHLLATGESIGRLRGRIHRFRDTDIPVVVTYHPAYLLRSPTQKHRAWDDLQLALSVARRSP